MWVPYRHPPCATTPARWLPKGKSFWPCVIGASQHLCTGLLRYPAAQLGGNNLGPTSPLVDRTQARRPQGRSRARRHRRIGGVPDWDGVLTRGGTYPHAAPRIAMSPVLVNAAVTMPEKPEATMVIRHARSELRIASDVGRVPRKRRLRFMAERCKRRFTARRALRAAFFSADRMSMK